MKTLGIVLVITLVACGSSSKKAKTTPPASSEGTQTGTPPAPATSEEGTPGEGGVPVGESATDGGSYQPSGTTASTPQPGAVNPDDPAFKTGVPACDQYIRAAVVCFNGMTSLDAKSRQQVMDSFKQAAAQLRQTAASNPGQAAQIGQACAQAKQSFSCPANP